MNVPSKNKGFTIIEVVLVLAIAGLIFLVVFLALPALQRGQRDTQRKQDLGKVMSQVTSYQSNNQGSLPTDWDGAFKTSYLTINGASFADPSNGSTYTLSSRGSTTGINVPTAVPAGSIWVYQGVNCSNVSAGTGTISATSRTFAAIIYQEQGAYSCQNN
jgi:prepilin-type N-terminal cleavage/methylation domain-containing protein